MTNKFVCLHSGKCCEKSYTQINITIGDIIRIANFLKCDIKHLFDKNIVGLRAFGDGKNKFQISLGLQIPCVFRKNSKCDIYTVRPLNCRLFPYWILADIPKEKIKHYVDPSYKCVHQVSMTPQVKSIYKKYTKELANILEQESRLTEQLLHKYNLSGSLDISKLPDYLEVEKELKKLSLSHKDIKLEKKSDAVRICFANKSITKKVPIEFIKEIEKYRDENYFSRRKDLVNIDHILANI